MGDGKAKRPGPTKAKSPRRAPAAPQRPRPNNTILAIRALRERRAHAAHEVANAGLASANAPLPHLDRIQASFGHHDLSQVRTQTGGVATASAEALGASAYTVGQQIGFAQPPDLRTAAHEAAHVVQQQGGVHLANGVDGGTADPLERHANAVADAVVRGRSAEALLTKRPQPRSQRRAVVQRKSEDEAIPGVEPQGFVERALARAEAARARAEAVDAERARVNDEQYCNTYRHDIAAAIADRIRTVGLPQPPHPRLYWIDTPRAEQALIDGLTNDLDTFGEAVLHRLADLAYPTDLYKIVDNARQAETPEQYEQWHDIVGVAIANALTEPLDASIQRMAMRLRVQLDAHAEQKFADLVPSRPLDVIVGDVLKRPEVIGSTGHATVGDTTKEFQHGTRPVTFQLVGERDATLWNWIAVTSPKDATPEDVASTELIPGNPQSVMGAEQAYRIAASPPYFGIPVEYARQIDAMLRFTTIEERAAALSGRFSRIAGVRALHESTVADEAALAQAPMPARGTPPLDRLLDRIETQLGVIGDLLSRVHAEGFIAGARAFVARRRDDLQRDPKQATRWGPAATAQQAVLFVVSSELGELFDDIDRGPKASALSIAVSDLIRAYARAAGASHLAAEAMPLLVAAQREKALLPIAQIAEEARETPAIMAGAEAAEANAHEAADAQPDLEPTRIDDAIAPTTAIADLRLRLTRGETVTSIDVSRAQSDLSERTMRARLTTILATLAELSSTASKDGYYDRRPPGAGWSVGMVIEKLERLIKEPELPHGQQDASDTLYGGWLPRLDFAKEKAANPKEPDPNGMWMQPAIAYIDRELALLNKQVSDKDVQGIRGFLAWWRASIVHAKEVDDLIKSLAEQIGIMFVTMQATEAAFSAIRGLMIISEIIEDGRTGSIAFEVGQVVVGAGLQTIGSGLVGGEVSAGSFAENALAMVLGTAAMRPFKALLKEDAARENAVNTELKGIDKLRLVDKLIPNSAAGKAIARSIGAGAKVTAHIAVEFGGNMAGSAAARGIVYGTSPDVNAEAWLEQGAMLAINSLASKLAQGMHERITTAARAFRAAHLREAARQLDALGARSAALDARAKSTKHPSAEVVEALLGERHAILTAEQAIYQANGATSTAVPQSIEATLFRSHLSPVVEGRAYEGKQADIERAIEGLHATRDNKTGVWTVEDAGRTVTIKEIDFNELAEGDEKKLRAVPGMPGPRPTGSSEIEDATKTVQPAGRDAFSQQVLEHPEQLRNDIEGAKDVSKGGHYWAFEQQIQSAEHKARNAAHVTKVKNVRQDGGVVVRSQYNVRTYEGADGMLTEISIDVYMRPGEAISDVEMQIMKDHARNGLDRFYNFDKTGAHLHKLPDGSNLHVRVNFVDGLADADLVVTIENSFHPMTGEQLSTHQYVWRTYDASEHMAAHELSHQMGLIDEYSEVRSSARVVHTDNSLMGDFVTEGAAKATVKPRHIEQIGSDIENARNSELAASKKTEPMAAAQPVDEAKAATETQLLPVQTEKTIEDAPGMPTYSSVEIVDASNKPIGELDQVVRDGVVTDRFVENKNAKGLSHPKNRQTAEEWARDQLFDKTNKRISALENPQASSRANPNRSGSPTVPSIADLRGIKAFVFEIESQDPKVISAVNAVIAELTKLHAQSGYTFTAKFGISP